MSWWQQWWAGEELSGHWTLGKKGGWGEGLSERVRHEATCDTGVSCTHDKEGRWSCCLSVHSEKGGPFTMAGWHAQYRASCGSVRSASMSSVAPTVIRTEERSRAHAVWFYLHVQLTCGPGRAAFW
jgi:hypothetical protein